MKIFFGEYGDSLAAKGLDGVEVGGAARGECDGCERRQDEQQKRRGEDGE